MPLRETIRTASLAALVGLLAHYAVYYALPAHSTFSLLTDAVAEWMMVRTPNSWSVWILQSFGVWAKPLAMTGALAMLGFGLWLVTFMASCVPLPPAWRPGLVGIGSLVLAGLAELVFGYQDVAGLACFYVAAAAVLVWRLRPAREEDQVSSARRTWLARGSTLLPAVMSSGTVAVALESYWREEALSRKAAAPAKLYDFHPPAEREQFAPGLVRPAVTLTEPRDRFYGMSKNAVDPAIDPVQWRLAIKVDGRLLREVSYRELLSLPRVERYVTLRCVSNDLKSDLMGTASWSGIHLSQLIDRSQLPPGIQEVATIGVDGHGDSMQLDYAFQDEVLFALGMNGRTLNRKHGFPIRLLAPRYYGFRNTKWIGELQFLSTPYTGYYQKMGYTREPVIHTMSHIDGLRRMGSGQLAVAGVAFAGSRGIQRVQVRADQGGWVDALLEPRLSGYTWTRWQALLPDAAAKQVESRAQDGEGRWQSSTATPLFPDGMQGPTIKEIRL